MQMEELKKQRKIYTEKNLWTVAFLGGPLSAGYVIAENFKTFNETKKVKITWGITVALTLLIFGFLPETTPKNLPYCLIPLIYTAIAAAIMNHYQKIKITDYLANGGEKHSWGYAICVGFIGLAVTVLLVVIGLFITGNLSGESTYLESKTYGKLHHEIFYDKTNISENEIDKIAYGLTETSFFGKEVHKKVVVEKIDNNYEITISIVKKSINNYETLTYFIQLKNELQNFFPDNKIVINLTPDCYEYYENEVRRIE